MILTIDNSVYKVYNLLNKSLGDYKMSTLEYSRKYREKNREKLRENYKRFKEKNREKVREYAREYRRALPKGKNRDIAKIQKVSEYNKASFRKLKIKFLEMYGNQCKCCGEVIEEFLTIEHINGQKGAKKETSYKSYSNAIKEYRPNMYEVLCMNCNHAKGRLGVCPHQR